MCPGAAPHREPLDARPAARGRPAGRRGGDPHPGGAEPAVPEHLRLGLPHRPPGTRGRAGDLLAARAHARRVLVDERHDLHPGQPARLRHLAGRIRVQRLGLCRPDALLPPGGGQLPRRRRLPRRDRAVVRLRPVLPVADAYLRPAMERPNLEVKTDVRATKVVVEGGRAAGVRYLQRGTEETAYVQGEVIVSCGAIGSPQLLMLSGIGPADHLRELGITVMVDSPGVGVNLSDHPVVPAMWRTPKVPALWEKAGPKNLFRWQLRHSGPFTSNIAESGGFSRTRPS